MKANEQIQKPIHRSLLRHKLGMIYYGTLRKYMWIKMNKIFSTQKTADELPYLCFSHRTLLLRKLKDVDMWMQHNKIINLKVAAKRMSGIVLKPGEIYSYWKLIGKPSKRKGYVDGMVLSNGRVTAGVGGGLCQMSNLIFWMALHTPLTVIERHRHGYDVFPDSNRTQPFGSGATCFYPHGDLMIRNDTDDDYQLTIFVGDEYLEGAWHSSAQPEYSYEIVERNHEMKSEYWGGYSRHNELYKQKFDANGALIEEYLIVKNSSIMMYSPFLTDSSSIVK